MCVHTEIFHSFIHSLHFIVSEKKYAKSNT